MIGLTLPLVRLVVSACSFVWQLFSLALVFSGTLGDAAVIDKGRSSKSL
jgi:hypothetical protein